MEQAKDGVLKELAVILKVVKNLEVRLLHVETILHKNQICKNEGLCRDVKNLELEMHDIGAVLEEVIFKYFNVCDEIRKVYWLHARGERVAAVMEGYDKAEDYAWKRFGLSDISRCFERKKRSE